ncbi:chorismate mutase [Desulfolucanica intricata]|uniref:chorismate mutase n=1 Tax=Desulfolucanica intricata TaxID=1285191 RepID=UPI00082F335F|nr:chorismate mutase [Desulfolucanica intricata]
MAVLIVQKLEQIRKEIDTVDEGIVKLLGKRTQLVEQIAEVKKESNQVRDENRENQILLRLCNLANQNGINVKIVEQIYRMLFEYFVDLQHNQLRGNKM